MVVRPAGMVHTQMLDVRGGKEKFKWMHGRQTEIFGRRPSVNFLDRGSPTVKKGNDAASEDVHGVRCSLRGIDFRKRDAGIPVHDCFDIDTTGSANIADILDRAEEKRFLEK